MLWYKGRKDFPYFDASSNALFRGPDLSIAAVDYNQDGFKDYLAYQGGSQYGKIELFFGKTNIGINSKIYSDDSIFIPTGFYLLPSGMVANKFGKNLPTQILFGWYQDSAGKADF